MHYLDAISKWQKDLSSFPRQAIQHHSNPRLCPNHWCKEAEVEWFYGDPQDLLKLTPKERCPFHHRRLECKSRKSRDTWNNRHIWPWSTKWTQERANSIFQDNTLVIENPIFQQRKRGFYTWTSPDGQYWNQIDYIICSQRWRSSIQSEKIKTGSWLWLRSWTPYCQIQT